MNGPNQVKVYDGAPGSYSGKINGMMKLNHPNIRRERFGYVPHESIGLLRDWGLQMKLVVRENAFPKSCLEDMHVHFDPVVYSHLLVTTKC